MLQIDPALLSNASQSPCRSAFEQGYRRLRFAPALERQFRLFYTAGHLVRVRLAGFLGIILFGMFVLIDLATLPSQVAVRTVGIRVFLIIPSFIATLVVSYRKAWQRHIARAVFGTSLATGLGTVAVIAVAFSRGVQIPYEGILLVTLFIYLIACLRWWLALLGNVLILLAFVGMEWVYQSDPQARLYQTIFMCAANAVGAYGGYFLEYNIRTMFLVNTLLQELAERDGLTALANRRTLNIHLERVWRQALREQHPLAIAMIDIDFFKRFNDRYGHAEGDAALKAVADAIADQARRPMDLAARYGGEEFAVVWFDPTADQLQRMGDDLTEAVVALGIAHQDSELGKLSISVGIALMQPAPGLRYADLLCAADTALYEAKRQGRNRTVVAPP